MPSSEGLRSRSQQRGRALGRHGPLPDSGSGPPLVFVHGLLVDGTLWRKVTPLLEDRFRCVVPDWLALIDDSWTYVPEDRPERLAELIGEFVAGE